MRTKTEHVPQYREEKQRGDHAKIVLENPLFKAATEAMRGKLIESWLRTAPNDVEGREWFHKMMLAQVAYQQSLTKMVQTGDMAAISLAQAEEPAPTKRRTRNG